MPSLNKVFLIGNLTRAPELRYTPSGAAVCEFGMAMNRTYTSNNERKEEVCFVDVNVWGKQAETCNMYLKKGDPLFVEGRLHLDQWTDKETQKQRSRLRVVAERTQFLGKAGGDGQDGYPSTPPQNQQQQAFGNQNQSFAQPPPTPPAQQAFNSGVRQQQQQAAPPPPASGSPWQQPPPAPPSSSPDAFNPETSEDDIPF